MKIWKKKKNFHLLCPSTFNIGLNVDGEGDDCLRGGVVDVAIDEVETLLDNCELRLVFSVASRKQFQKLINNHFCLLYLLLSLDNLRIITLSLTKPNLCECLLLVELTSVLNDET